jgi:hypothetical protein
MWTSDKERGIKQIHLVFSVTLAVLYLYIFLKFIVEHRCGQAFGYKSALKRHAAVHVDVDGSITPFACTHPGCDKRFKTVQYMKIHRLRHNRK